MPACARARLYSVRPTRSFQPQYAPSAKRTPPYRLHSLRGTFCACGRTRERLRYGVGCAVPMPNDGRALVMSMAVRLLMRLRVWLRGRAAAQKAPHTEFGHAQWHSKAQCSPTFEPLPVISQKVPIFLKKSSKKVLTGLPLSDIIYLVRCVERCAPLA
jgi:hypothetical protein